MVAALTCSRCEIAERQWWPRWEYIKVRISKSSHKTRRCQFATAWTCERVIGKLRAQVYRGLDAIRTTSCQIRRHSDALTICRLLGRLLFLFAAGTNSPVWNWIIDGSRCTRRPDSGVNQSSQTCRPQLHCVPMYARWHLVRFIIGAYDIRYDSLTLWRPLLSYGYSYIASCALPG